MLNRTLDKDKFRIGLQKQMLLCLNDAVTEVDMINVELQKTCDDFIDYRELLRGTNIFSSTRSVVYPLCAYICMIRRQEPNTEIINLCKQIIHESYGVFNNFRGFSEKTLTVLLSCESDPGRVNDLCGIAYAELRDLFSASDYLPVLAFFMATTMPPAEYRSFAESTKALHELFNDMHPWLTGEEDTIFDGLLNATGRNHEELVEETEKIWRMLKDDFRFHKNALQTAAHAMTLCPGDPALKAGRFHTIFTMLRSEGISYSKDFEIVPLAVLANIGIEPQQIVEDFLECEAYLKDNGRYGFWTGYSTSTRYMHAVLVLSVYYQVASNELTAAFVVSVLIEIYREISQEATTAATV